MNKKTRLKIAISLLLCCFCFSACWDHRPIEDLAIVASIGIDISPTNPELIDVTIGYPIFAEDQRKAVKFDTVTANNVRQAFDLCEQRNALNLELGKVRVILFGNDAAEQGLPGLFDYIALPIADDNAFVAVVAGRADELLAVQVPETERTSFHVQALLRTNAAAGYIPKVTVADLATAIVVPGLDAFLPLLKLQDEERVVADGIALFREGRMVGSLSSVEMQYFMALQGRTARIPLTLIVGETEQLAKPSVELQLLSPKTSIKPKLVGDQLEVNLRLKASYVLRSSGSSTNLNTGDAMADLTQDIRATLYLECLQLLAKLQELRTDPLGIGKKFRVHNYQEFDELDFADLWANAAINLEVKLKAIRGGALHTTKQPGE